ncbi:MAG: GNAT family N-acetyltransferase [Vulcanimicrobiaceae bacterium]
MRGSSLLEILDRERRLLGSSSDGSGLFREWSPDRSECRIVFSDLSPSQLAVAVHDEQAKARDGGYALEWKVYGHDPATGLTDMLVAAGFEASDVETVLVLDLDTVEGCRFDGPPYETRRIHDDRGLADVAAISRQVGRQDVEAESNRLGAMLRERPEGLSIHVAYLDGEPVSSGRIHYGHSADVAELAGGRTVPARRKRGLFSAVVAARLREAAARGCRYVFVDALPTSEPILSKLGFAALTSTQPFT